MQMAKRLFQLEHFLVDFMDRPIRLPLGSPITDERALSSQVAKSASRRFDKWQTPCGFLRETQKRRLAL